jgi:hypothetical protein
MAAPIFPDITSELVSFVTIYKLPVGKFMLVQAMETIISLGYILSHYKI